MPTFEDRPNTALLVIDVQNDVVAAAHERDSVVANIASLVERARVSGTPVVWIQHDDDELPHGTTGWELVPELVPTDDEAVVGKQHRDAFEATTLEAVLADAGVGSLVVTGAQTDFCVRWTLHGALTRGYDTVLVSDAHTTDDLSAYGLPTAADIIRHTNLFWSAGLAPDRTSGTATAAEVTFA